MARHARLTSCLALAAAAAGVLVATPALAQPREPGLNLLEGANYGSFPGGVGEVRLSGNGRFAVLNVSGSMRVWRGGTGVEPLPLPPGFLSSFVADGISDDGRVIGAYRRFFDHVPSVVARFMEGTGWETAEHSVPVSVRKSATSARVSADGSRIVGFYSVRSGSAQQERILRTFVWPTGGTLEVHPGPDDEYTNFDDATADLSVFVGSNDIGQAMLLRPPGSALVRASMRSVASAISPEGGVIAGTRGNLHQPVRWDTNLQNETPLPLPPGTAGAWPVSVSTGGSIIVGIGTDPTYPSRDGVVWRGNAAPMNMTEFLARRGVPVPAPYTRAHPLDMSADGRTLMGYLYEEEVIAQPVFIAVLPCRADFTNDGELTFDDIASFVAQYNAQTLRADLNEDNEWTFEDVQIFIAAFNGQEC